MFSLMWLLFRLIPGDPASIYISGRLTPEEIVTIKKSWGLNDPLYIQYGRYISNVLSGDMGTSFVFREKVVKVVIPRLLNTVMLMGPAMLFAIFIGVILGSYLGWKRGS